MTGSSIAAALEVLCGPAAGGAAPEIGSHQTENSWLRLVDLLQGSGRGSRKKDFERSYPLESPGECAAAHVEEIEQTLGKGARVANRAALLKRLAAWWVETFGDEAAPDWDGSADRWRESLRGIRGVNHEMADRILLEAAGKPAWPVTRAAIRIACRHGWIDPHAEYDDWQSSFVRACESDTSQLLGLSHAFDEVGHEHCGPTPDCTGCPLAPLLPTSGPIESFD